MIKKTPPIGVNGPKNFQEAMPNTSRQARRYNEPENKKMPIKKLQPAYFKNLAGKYADKMAVIAIAKVR